MDVDERHCPGCGHDVLNWDVACPGCDQVPWNSPAGRRIMRQRRRWHTVVTAGPVALFLALAVGVVVIVNLHSMKARQWTRREHELEEILDRASWLAGMLAREAPGTSAHEELLASGQQWVANGLPKLLAAAADASLPTQIRLDALRGILALSAESSFSPMLAEHRADLLTVLLPVASEQDRRLKHMAIVVLTAIGAGDELRAQHPELVRPDASREVRETRR